MNDAGGTTSLHLRRARAGDASSTAWLVERLSPLLLAQARYRLQGGGADLVEPEDLVQETWMVALGRLGDLEPRDGRVTPVLVRFLATTLLQQLNNHRRRQVRRQTRAPGAPGGGAGAREVPAGREGPATRADARAREDAVLEAIEGLGPEDRAVLVLRGIEQLDNRTAATLLGLSPNATSIRYRRALARLRTELPASVLGELHEA